MNRVAQLSRSARRDLVQETAALRGVSPAVIEKDFWVCWVLKQIFTDSVVGSQLIFKGGTSLSKVYNLIERCSEDIDLILDWRLLGYGRGREDPYRDFAPNTQRDRFNKQVNERAAKYIADTLVREFSRLFGSVRDLSAAVDEDDPHTVNVAYPAVFCEAFLRPVIRLEIGPLAAWTPSESRTIRPYVAESIPQVFDHSDCPVTAISAERSCWEKATNLHQQAHRKKPMLPRYRRHYYDLYKLAGSRVRETALGNLDLLDAVTSFKRRFYPSSWASYETARAGSLKLIPGSEQRAALAKDYRAMRLMIFGAIPPLGVIVDSLKELEQQINQQA